MRLIDADALIEKLGIAKECNDCKHNKEPYCGWKPDVVDICEAINDAQTIEPERKTGKWIPDATGWEFCCSECGYSVMFGGEANTFKYCPECGAKMDKECDNETD